MYSDEVVAAAKELLKRRSAMQNMLDFARYVMPPRYSFDAPHIKVLANTIYNCVTRKTPRVILMLPPQHLKTTFGNVLLSAFAHGLNPNERIISSSSAQRIAQRNSKATRDLETSALYNNIFPETQTKPRQNVSFWHTGHSGYYYACGVKGMVNSIPADILICDDLLRGRKDSRSSLIKDDTWSYYTSDLLGRLHPNSIIVHIATRWAIDDPIGRVLDIAANKSGEEWTVVRFPAQCEVEQDELGRRKGDYLWTDYRNNNDYETTRLTLTVDEWESVFQQNPRPAEGGLFKALSIDASFIETCDIPKNLRYIRAWDLATTAKTQSDYTVGALCAVDVNTNVFYILDIYRNRLEYPQLKQIILHTAMSDTVDVPVCIEKAGMQSVVFQDIKNELYKHGYQIWGYEPKGDKFTRALSFAASLEHGRVRVAKSLWNSALVNELLAFSGDGDTHDDQVDAVVMSYNMLSRYANYKQIFDLIK